MDTKVLPFTVRP